MSRSGAAALLALVAAMSLVGCTSDAKPDDKPSPTVTPSPTEGPVTLRFEVYGDEATVATYRQLTDAYTAAHPNVTFSLSATETSDAGAEAAVGAIQSGIDAPDLFVLDVDHLAQAVEADVLQPVDELLEERGIPFGDGIQRVGLTAFSANNGLACMPYDITPHVVFYNRRLIKPRQLFDEDERRHSIDKSWTWERFGRALALTASEGAKGTYLPPDLRDLAPLILSGGGSLVDDDREPTQLELADSGTKDALKLMALVTRDPGLSLTPADVRSKPAIEWFKEGKLGTLFGTRRMVPELRATPGLRFDVAPIPTIDDPATTSLMDGYCIAKTSEHIDEAADFIAWATDGDGLPIATSSGRIVPSSLDALHSDEFLQSEQLPRNAALFGELSRKSLPTPYSTRWVPAASAVGSILERVLYGTTIDVVSQETPELDELLEQTDEASKPMFNPPEPTPTP